MTVSSSSNRISYTGNGTTTAFAFPYEFDVGSDLKVYLDGTLQTITTHYTVSGGSGSSGTVTFVTAPATTKSVVIYDDPPATQLLDYIANDPFPAESHEGGLDKLTRLVRRVKDLVTRSMRLPDSYAGSASTELPTPSAQKIIGWNAAANALVNYAASDLTTVAAFAAWQSQTFSGNGVTTAFVLSSDPGNIANLDIAISGVTQTPTTDYTLSGTTLTFTTAPPTGTNNILARWGQALPQGVTNANAVNYTPGGTGAVTRTVESRARERVFAKDFAVTGDGTTNDYAAMVVADNAATALGAVLVLGPGTYKLDTSLAFTAPVVMDGGIIAGSGTASFPAGFSAPAYYCFDCLVGQIRTPFVLAEWFGARQSTATPTSTGASITSKAWNTWPAWVTGATYTTDPGHDYGDAAYLAANKPFANGDTWDHIAVQRALWALGQVTTGYRGEVRLQGAKYYFNKAVRYTGEMASTLSGAGKTKTLFDSADWATHGAVSVDSGTARAMLHFYKTGPDPTIIEGVGFTGPSGYVYGGSPPIYHVTHIGANGVVHRNQWVTTADAGWYFGSSCSDCTLEDFHTEYCRRSAYGYDALSWATIRHGAFWEAGASAQAVDFLRYVFMKGCELVGYTLEPIVYGEGSHLSGITIIQDSTDYKTHIDGNTIKRRVRAAAGTTATVLTVQMPTNSAVRTRMVAGGVVQGVGAAGVERTLTWYREAVAPVAAGSAATEWGTAGAVALVAEGTATTAGGTFSLTLVNTGSGSEHYDAYVTITIEGSDCVLQGLT